MGDQSESDYSRGIMQNDSLRNFKRSFVMLMAANVALAFGFLASAHAKSPKPSDAQRESHQRRLFADFDLNHNGKLTRQEFVDVIISHLFQDFDKNNNGQITKAEFFKHARDKPLAEKEYPMMDSEAKGYITLKDVYRNRPFVLRLQTEFKKLDKTNKGYVTLEDLPDLTPGS